ADAAFFCVGRQNPIDTGHQTESAIGENRIALDGIAVAEKIADTVTVIEGDYITRVWKAHARIRPANNVVADDVAGCDDGHSVPGVTEVVTTRYVGANLIALHDISGRGPRGFKIENAHAMAAIG